MMMQRKAILGMCPPVHFDIVGPDVIPREGDVVGVVESRSLMTGRGLRGRGSHGRAARATSEAGVVWARVGKPVLRGGGLGVVRAGSGCGGGGGGGGGDRGGDRDAVAAF